VDVLNLLMRVLRAKASAAHTRLCGVRRSQRSQGRQPPASQARDWLSRDRGVLAGAAKPPLVEDLGFPQLEVVRDSERMRKVFQKHLRPLNGKTYQIRECLVSRVFHRKATRCVVLYTLHLEDPDTGQEWSQWVSGVMQAGSKPRRTWKKLRRSSSGSEVPGVSPVFEPFSYLSNLKMLVQVFPYDHQLPALSLLMAGPPPELEPLLLARFGPGDWRAEAWDVETVRYRASSRCTLRLTVQAQDATTGRAEERCFYAKVYGNEERGEQTYQVLQALWNRGNAGGVSFTVGRPIAYLSDLRTLVQEEAPGTSLKDKLLREENVVPAVQKVARALAALHLDHVPVPRQRRLWEEVRHLEKIGKLLQQACPYLEPEVKEIVGTVVAGLVELPLAPTHRDFHPDNILIDGDRLSLIDLDVFSEADPLLDVARLLVGLAFMPLDYSLTHERAQIAAQAFAEEYFVYVPEAWRTSLPLHLAAAFLKSAAGLLRSQPGRRPDMVEAIIKESKDSLEGRGWWQRSLENGTEGYLFSSFSS